MGDYEMSGRNISPLIRAWECELKRRGWNGSPFKMQHVAYEKALRGKKPPNYKP